jgi:hypothetical protein
MNKQLKKIISGGQTGVDRAALDVAIAFDIPHGGWCPRGRKAEDGRLDEQYALEETPSENYKVRTAWNVRDSEGTLVLVQSEPTGGTAFTIAMARKFKKPYLVFDLLEDHIDTALIWLENNKIEVLNVAGPRASQNPGIYQAAREMLSDLTK